MNEEQLAKSYEERRGDTSLWSERPAKARVRRGGTVVFSIRLTPEELELLRKRAEEERTTISELIRWGAIRFGGAPSRVYVRTLSKEFNDRSSLSVIDTGVGMRTGGSAAVIGFEEPSVDFTYRKAHSASKSLVPA